MTQDTSPPPAGDREDNAGRRLQQLRRLGIRRGRAGLQRPGAGLPPIEEAASHHPQSTPPARKPIEHLVGGEVVYTLHGPCVVVETHFPLTEARGGWPLAAALGVSGVAAAACGRDEGLAGFNFARAAFLDTETTGLAGGAGTFAFMVGIGTFEALGTAANSEELGGTLVVERSDVPGAAYVVRQVFMRHPGEERALLQVVASLLARCTGLVTFNGRAFDAPLLDNRYVMHHEPSPLADLLHLDLLPPARQRWRLRLPSCALGALEQHVLDYRRSEADVPGWLIPSLYQEYTRGGDTTPMARVFYHNREDIVSMAPLAAMLAAPFEENGRILAHHSLHPIDCSCLGRCYEDLGWLEAGEAAYRLALDQGLPAGVRAQTLHRLGWLLKRQERRAEALAIWQDWITSVPGPDPTPYVELAKHHEWHELDLAAARKWTLWGLHTARQMSPGPSREQVLADLQHRLERLERKLASP